MRSYIATLICRTRGFGAASSGVCELKVPAVATRPVDVYLIEVKAVVGAMCAPIASAVVAAAPLMESDSAMLLPIKYRSLPAINGHYGVSPSGQSVRGMQPPEIGPCGLGPPGHGSVYIVSVLYVKQSWRLPVPSDDVQG